MEQKEYIITENQAGERIDKLLSSVLGNDFSRSYIKMLLKEGRILLSGKPAKPSDKGRSGELISLTLPEKVMPDITPEEIPLDILYEDDDLMVINKPKDLVVHPAAGHWSGTLVNAVMHHCTDPETGELRLSGINGVLRPGIVHRIDKDTTGSVLICKNDNSHNLIAAQLKEHSLTRRYSAIVHGVIRQDDLTIDKPLGRDPKDRKKRAVTFDGKEAVTHVHVLERFQNFTYVECTLETGRTHQIRVHMASIGHPLLGDDVYGPRKKTPFYTEGQCLHAGILGFVHPKTGQYIETRAELPEYFENILKKLRSGR